MNIHMPKAKILDGLRVWHPSHEWGTVIKSYEDDTSDVKFDMEPAMADTGGVLCVTTSLLKKYNPKDAE